MAHDPENLSYAAAGQKRKAIPLWIHEKDAKGAHDNVECAGRPGAQILSVGCLKPAVTTSTISPLSAVTTCVRAAFTVTADKFGLYSR